MGTPNFNFALFWIAVTWTFLLVKTFQKGYKVTKMLLYDIDNLPVHNPRL